MQAELNNAAADRADVAQVRAGDVEAFAAIVRRWQTPLINLAYRFCGDRGRAEEMAQEAFLRAYRGLDGFRGDAAFSTWLFALATNLYRSRASSHTAADSGVGGRARATRSVLHKRGA